MPKSIPLIPIVLLLLLSGSINSHPRRLKSKFLTDRTRDIGKQRLNAPGTTLAADQSTPAEILQKWSDAMRLFWTNHSKFSEIGLAELPTQRAHLNAANDAANVQGEMDRAALQKWYDLYKNVRDGSTKFDMNLVKFKREQDKIAGNISKLRKKYKLRKIRVKSYYNPEFKAKAAKAAKQKALQAKKQAKRKAKRAAKQAKRKAKRAAKQAKRKAKRAAKQAKRKAKPAAKQAKRKAKPAAKQAKRKAKPAAKQAKRKAKIRKFRKAAQYARRKLRMVRRDGFSEKKIARLWKRFYKARSAHMDLRAKRFANET
jgi:flagellar biosynthesis GTPase FlhF